MPGHGEFDGALFEKPFGRHGRIPSRAGKGLLISGTNVTKEAAQDTDRWLRLFMTTNIQRRGEIACNSNGVLLELTTTESDPSRRCGMPRWAP
jgi:hypothetical protein